MQWQDEATKLPCLIVRNRAGALCGYVGITSNHPWFELEYDDALDGSMDTDYTKPTPERLITVHGGLTFSNSCQPTTDESHGICHLPEPGEPDHVWWFGFDCSHCNDYSPMMDKYHSNPLPGQNVYRTISYVQSQCASLAKQLLHWQTNAPT